MFREKAESFSRRRVLRHSLRLLSTIYAADAADTLMSYSLSIRSSVMVLNALPAILTKSNFHFVLLEIPSEKHASSSWNKPLADVFIGDGCTVRVRGGPDRLGGR